MLPDDGPIYVLETIASPSCLDALHALFAELWAGTPDVAATDRMAFETAVAEVAANIIEHAASRVEITLRLVLQADADKVAAHLEDGGYPYDPEAVEPAGNENLPEHGRGLSMARALADDLVYERDGAFNRWYLTRRRTAS